MPSSTVEQPSLLLSQHFISTKLTGFISQAYLGVLCPVTRMPHAYILVCCTTGTLPERARESIVSVLAQGQAVPVTPYSCLPLSKHRHPSAFLLPLFQQPRSSARPFGQPQKNRKVFWLLNVFSVIQAMTPE